MARVSPKFATGKYAWGMCDICGVRTKYATMKEPTIRRLRTNLRVCPSCYDPDHPQNFLHEFVYVDPQALRDARPDTGQARSRLILPPGNWGFDGKPLLESSVKEEKP